MFKIGDIVVCIDDGDDATTFEPYKNLKKYSTYVIDEYCYSYNVNSVGLTNIKGRFDANRFISLKEYRKLQLIKINKK